MDSERQIEDKKKWTEDKVLRFRWLQGECTELWIFRTWRSRVCESKIITLARKLYIADAADRSQGQITSI